MAEIFNFNDEKVIRECINAKQILDDHGDFPCDDDDWDIPAKANVIHVIDWQQDQQTKVEHAFNTMLNAVANDNDKLQRFLEITEHMGEEI